MNLRGYFHFFFDFTDVNLIVKSIDKTSIDKLRTQKSFFFVEL